MKNKFYSSLILSVTIFLSSPFAFGKTDVLKGEPLKPTADFKISKEEQAQVEKTMDLAEQEVAKKDEQGFYSSIISRSVENKNGPGVGAATTIKSALEKAYAGNVQITSAQAGKKSSDEVLAKAERGWFPEVSLSSSPQVTFTDQKTFTPNKTLPSGTVGQHTQQNNLDATVTLKQNIYKGGATQAGIEQARYKVEQLDVKKVGTEQNVLLSAASAYLGLLKDKALLENAQSNVKVFETQLLAAEAKFEVGEETVATVESVRAQLEKAKADAIAASAQVAISEAVYIQNIGEVPQYPLGATQVPDLTPTSMNEAIDLCIKHNATIREKDAIAKIAEAQIQLASSQLAPSIDLQVTGGRTLTSSIGDNSGVDRNQGRYLRTRQNQVIVGAAINLPLDFRGSSQADVRAAKYDAASARLDAIQARREQVAQVIADWQSLQSADAQIKQFEAQIKSTDLALNSMKEEFLVGSKTYLDVITAENEALAAKNNMVKSQRDKVVAAYKLLADMGVLTAKNLELGVAPQDAQSTTDETEGKFWGTGIDEFHALNWYKEDPVMAQFKLESKVKNPEILPERTV
jgi:outer membrane protein